MFADVLVVTLLSAAGNLGRLLVVVRKGLSSYSCVFVAASSWWLINLAACEQLGDRIQGLGMQTHARPKQYCGMPGR